MSRAPQGVLLVLALCSCTGRDGDMVEAPEVPDHGTWMYERPEEPAPPPPRNYRYEWGVRLALLRATQAEAEAGRRAEHRYELEHPWVREASETLCAERACADDCVVELWVPRRRCGGGLGEGIDVITVEGQGCGLERTHRYEISYTLLVPLVISEELSE